jgi:hypothetical protein
MPGTVDVAGGLLDLHETDALAIAQNQGTCLVFTMPREAIRRDADRFVTPRDSTAATIMAQVASGHSGKLHQYAIASTGNPRPEASGADRLQSHMSNYSTASTSIRIRADHFAA